MHFYSKTSNATNTCMNRFLPIIVFSILSVNTYALTLNAEVDRNEISLNESLRLIVTADEIISKSIDFTQLSLQFEILNTQRSSQQTFRNGALSATTRWILILSPKETGDLLIPSFELEGVFSPAIKIKVKKANVPQAQSIEQRDAFLQASVNKNRVYVQEQVLLTLTLYYQVALSSYEAEAVSVDNAVVELVSEKNFRTNLRGREFKVLELIYAIHPQASGDLFIPTQSWRLERASPGLNFGRSGNFYLRVQSEPLNITVAGIPSDYQGEHWLPATAVTLDAEWPEVSKITIGEPIHLKLHLTADGLTNSQLPDLSIDSTESFTIFDDQSQTADKKSSSGITGNRTSQFAIIPKKVGSFTLPEIALDWWNVDEDRQETIRVSARTIQVFASEQTTENIPKVATEGISNTPPPSYAWIWQMTTILFASIAAYLGFCLYHKSNKSHQSPTTAESSDHIKLKKLHLLMQEAIAQSDWEALCRLIIRWGRIVNSSEKNRTLKELAALHPALNDHLQALESILYGEQAGSKWDPQDFYDELRKIKPRQKHNIERKQKTLALKSLHRFS